MVSTNYAILWWLVGYLMLCELFVITGGQQQHDLLDYSDSEIVDGECGANC